MAKTVLILGASFAGLKVAHSLLKTTLPQVKDLKVVLVSPSTHAYWNLATPRAIVPGQIPDSKLFAAIEPNFTKYPAGHFEFVLGSATAVDPESKKVDIQTESGNRQISYDTLVVATGASAVGGGPWKAHGNYQDTLDNLHATQEKVKSAKSIVVGGGGVTGVETAGELGFEYGGKKEITIISKDDGVLGNFLGPKVAANSLKELQARNVKVIDKTTVTEVSTLPSGQTELTLSNGGKINCDLYLPCVGVQANTSFLPKNLLNNRGELTVDPYFAVKGAKDIYALGDVADIQAKKVMSVAPQGDYLSKSLNAILTGKPVQAAYKVDTKPMGAITVGRSKGFGVMGSWSLPNFLIQFAKGKTMMVENLPKAVSGAM